MSHAYKTVAKEQTDMESLMRSHHATIRLLMTLISRLLADGTIKASDFSTNERSLYQAIKSKKDTLYPQ